MIKVRVAVPDDLEALVNIETDAFDPRKYTLMNHRQFREHVTNGRSVVLVAEHGGGPVGYALALRHARRRELRFYSLAVAAAAQGGAVGKVLFEAVEATAENARLGLQCEVRSDNVKLRARYASGGFREYQEIPGYYPDGVSCIKLRRSVRTPPA